MDKCNHRTRPSLPAQRGITIIGVVVSLAILTSTAIILSNSLIGRKEIVGSGREKFVAVSVAREGLELVRALRDNNWLQGESNWVRNICGGNPSFTLDAAMVRNGVPVGPANQDELWRASDGEWVHNGTAGTSTGFHRQLTVNCSEAAADPAVLTVTANVSWLTHRGTEQIAITEKLYNWFVPST